MKINYNMSAIIANNALTNSDNALASSLERLSSGFKINHAKDNAAGLAIAKRMHTQIEGLKIASSNAGNGISVIETAEGALSEIQDMLQRMNELAVKAANGTSKEEDKVAIQKEVEQLGKEIERVAADTEFNGQTLLDGNFDLRGYTSNIGVKVAAYSDEVRPQTYGITVAKVPVYDALGNVTTPPEVTLGANFPPGATVQYQGDEVTVKADKGFELKFQVKGNAALGPTTIDITGMGALDVQIGANEGQELALRIPKISLKTLDIDKINLANGKDAAASLEHIANGIAYVSATRSRLGAYQNRLEHTTSSLDITAENMTAAYSRIMDTDMAAEMTEYTKYQIMTQAGTSMLAQANERPQKALQLLQ
ncbi:MAG: flagellin [Lachnospiraceae bacterium]